MRITSLPTFLYETNYSKTLGWFQNRKSEVDNMAEKMEEIENLLSWLDLARESFEKVEEKEEELKDREVEILKQVFDSVAPLVEFVGDKQKRGYGYSGESHDERSYKFSNKPSIPLFLEYEYEDEKKLISKKEAKPKRISSGDENRGEYRGRSYELFEDGLKIRQYSGDWSNWQGEYSSYTGKIQSKISEEKAIRYLLENTNLEKILSKLKDRIEKARKEKDNKQKYIGKRIKTIKALESVLDL